jgi:branched-chain amino acid transport system ATP-binding protein
MTPVLEVRDVSVSYGSVEVVHAVSVTVEAGSILGIIGPNGAGKTTLLDALSGLGPLSSGAVVLAGHSIERLPPHHRARRGMTRTFQSLELFDDLTVGENLSVAAEGGRAGGRAVVAERVARAAALAGLDSILERVPTELSHAMRKRLALGRALAGAPSVVLLDEPAGGLDGSERAALGRTLRTIAGDGTAVVLVDHDMGLVLDVCEAVCILDLGRVVARGTPTEVRADPNLTAAYLGKGDEGFATPRGLGAGQEGPGETVVAVGGLSAGYAGAPVLRGVDLEVKAGEIVALLGANGAGKTTMLRVLSGLLPASEGRVEVLGREVHGGADEVARRGLAHAPQDRSVLPALTVAENLRLASKFDRAGVDIALGALPRLVPLMARRAGDLSGGEQQILALGRASGSRPKVLMVDELSLGLSTATLRDVVAMVQKMAVDGVGVLFVEQHPHLALAIADRAYVLQRGRITLEGRASQIAAGKDALEAAYLG